MKIKKNFWRDGKALWIQIIAFAVAVMLYSVCCYPIYTSSKARIMRQLYEAELERYPDVLSTRQISDFTGYEKSSVERWCTTGHLKHFFIRKKFLVPKDYLLEFIESPYYIGIAVKSKIHKKRNQKLLQYQAKSRSATHGAEKSRN